MSATESNSLVRFFIALDEITSAALFGINQTALFYTAQIE